MNNYSLCCVLIQSLPEKTAFVKKELENTSGVEVHNVTQSGSLVVSVESNNRKFIGSTITNFNNIPGVLTASLRYEFSDDVNPNEMIELNANDWRVSV